MGNVLKITAQWDEEAKVWVAESDDVPGLVTEADTVSALIAKLKVIVPELVEENGNSSSALEIPFELMASCTVIANRIVH